MSKSLLVEYMPFKPLSPLTEADGAKFGIPGGMVVQGVLQRAGAKNQNGRISYLIEGKDFIVVSVTSSGF